MPLYRYRAVDQNGNRVSGELDADGPEELKGRLEAEGFRVESVAPAPGGSGAGRRLSAEEAAQLTQHISALTRAGLPLAAGLRAFAEELPAGPLRRVISGITDALSGGSSLVDAIEAHRDRLPAHLRALVRAGLASGKLGEVLGRFVYYYQMGVELRRKVWLSMAYPIILLAMLGLVFLFFLTVVVKGLTDIYTDFGINLPPATESLIFLSQLVMGTGGWVPFAVVVAAGTLWLAGAFLLDAAARRRIAYRVPLIGPLWRWTSLAEFCHLLGLLVESEVPLPAALELAGEGVSDPDIAESCRGMVRDVEAGGSLADSASRDPRLPAGLAQVLAWGQGHRALPESLHTAGDIFEGRARVQGLFVSEIMPPLLVVLVVTLMAYLVAALFMPIIQLISALSL